MTQKIPPHPGRRLAELPNSAYDCTLDVVAQEMGITRERVRQLEHRALRKAWQILTKRGYTLVDFLECARHE